MWWGETEAACGVEAPRLVGCAAHGRICLVVMDQSDAAIRHQVEGGEECGPPIPPVTTPESEAMPLCTQERLVEGLFEVAWERIPAAQVFFLMPSDRSTLCSSEDGARQAWWQAGCVCRSFARRTMHFPPFAPRPSETARPRLKLQRAFWDPNRPGLAPARRIEGRHSSRTRPAAGPGLPGDAFTTIGPAPPRPVDARRHRSQPPGAQS